MLISVELRQSWVLMAKNELEIVAGIGEIVGIFPLRIFPALGSVCLEKITFSRGGVASRVGRVRAGPGELEK